jgi:hypothetical protein
MDLILSSMKTPLLLPLTICKQQQKNVKYKKKKVPAKVLFLA